MLPIEELLVLRAESDEESGDHAVWFEGRFRRFVGPSSAPAPKGLG